MRHAAHFLIGIIAFLLYSGLRAGIATVLGLDPAGLWLIALFLAAAGAAMPDILEPARNWSHRGFFHSRRILSIAGWAFVATAMCGLLLPASYYCSAFLLGYFSHLAADSTTKAGLPR